MEAVSIFTDGMKGAVVGFEQLTKPDKKSMNGIISRERITVFPHPKTLYVDQEKVKEQLKILSMSERIRHADFTLHTIDDGLQFAPIIRSDVEERFFLERIEDVLLQEAIDIVLLTSQEGFIEVNDATLAGALIKMVHLSFGDKEERIRRHFVLIEIHIMLSTPGHKPNDLIESMRMRRKRMASTLGQVLPDGGGIAECRRYEKQS